MSEPYFGHESLRRAKKEDKPFLMFCKPGGWITHKTLDGIDVLSCSLACFRAFIGMGICYTTNSSKETR